jgi:hypothetical protein
MHACWILLCMSLNILSYASLLNKKVPVRVRSPLVSLKVAYPGLWVARYVIGSIKKVKIILLNMNLFNKGIYWVN